MGRRVWGQCLLGQYIECRTVADLKPIPLERLGKVSDHLFLTELESNKNWEKIPFWTRHEVA